MKRLAALVLAVGLVVGAITAAQSIYPEQFGGDDGAGADTDTTTSVFVNAGPLDVVCATEFEAACDALADRADLDGIAEFRTQTPGRTAAALAADPQPDFDLWITSDPWPEIAAVRASAEGNRAPKLSAPSEPLAFSVLEMVARRERVAAIGAACEAVTFTGKCLSEQIGRPFSEIGIPGDSVKAKLGLAPTDTTAGLLAVAALATGWFPTDYDTTDIAVNDGFRATFSRLSSTSETVATPISKLLTIPQFTIGLDLQAQYQLAAAADGASFQALPFRDRVTALAIVVASDTRAGRAAGDRLALATVRSALLASGWQRTGNAPDSNLPDAALLDALVTQWSTS